MPNQLSFKYAPAAFLLAVGVCLSSPALAGFQWVAPSDSAAAPPMGAAQDMSPTPSFAPVAPQTAASTTPEIISPVVITGNSAPAPVASAPPQPIAPVQPAPVVMASVQPAPAASEATVVGFAKSVPLAVALRQILPNGYAFSIDQDVDMGTLVSFRGGRGWRETLRDALAPAGLVMHEQVQMVEVGFPPHGMMPVPVEAVAPQPQPTPVPYQVGMEPKSLTISSPGPITSPAAMSAPMAETNDSWTAERGDRLRKVLENWSQRANVEFDWLSEYDYPLQASVSYSGGFEGAVRNLLTGFEGAHPQPVAELHSNPNLGQMVLVVQTRGNTNSD